MSFLAADALGAVAADVEGGAIAEGGAAEEGSLLGSAGGSPREHISVHELGPTRLAGVAERALHPHLGFAAVLRGMESEEKSIFASYSGKYVDSGHLLASLTESGAEGAIRRLTPTGALFGTSVWYAGFQGTTGDGDHGGPSAIVKVSEIEAALAARSVAEYVLHGGVL